MKGLIMGLVLLLSACVMPSAAGPVPETPREQLAAAELAYTGALEGVVHYTALGLVDAQRADAILKSMRVADASLDNAKLAIKVGKDPGTSLEQANVAILVLIDILEKLDGEHDPGTQSSLRPYGHSTGGFPCWSRTLQAACESERGRA